MTSVQQKRKAKEAQQNGLSCIYLELKKLKILFDLANDNRRGGEDFERNSLRRHYGNGIEREDHGGKYQVGDGHEDDQHCCRVPAKSENEILLSNVLTSSMGKKAVGCVKNIPP